MANFAGNVSFFKFSVHLQSRVLLLTPWVKKASLIRCCGNYSTSSSSGPVRYIPKKFSKLEEIEERKPRRRNLRNPELDNNSDLVPLRKEVPVPEKRLNFGKRSQNGVSFDSKAENVESSNVFGIGSQKMQPGKNLGSVESDSVLLRNGVSEKRSDVGKRSQNGVSFDSKAETLETSNVFGTGIQKMQSGKNLGSVESDNYSDSIPLRNAEKRLNFGKITQVGVNYNSKAENVKSSNVHGMGIQKMQPGQNLENAESDTYSTSIPLRNEVSEKISGKGIQNGVPFNSKAENVDSSNVFGTGIQKMQPGKTLGSVVSDIYSDSIPLRNGVSEKSSNFGKRTQIGVNYNSKAENVKSSSVYGTGIQKTQPGRNSENAESATFANSIPSGNEVSEKISNFEKRSQNGVSYNSKAENVKSGNVCGTGIQKMRPDQHLGIAESETYSNLMPLRNEVPEERSNFGERSQNGVSYRSKAENGESRNMLGIGNQKMQPGQSLDNVESDNYLIPVRHDVSDKRPNIGTRTQNAVSYNSKAENVESSNMYGIGIQKMQPGLNLQNAELDNYSDLTPVQNEVLEKRSNFEKTTRNGFNFNSKAENVESRNMFGIGIQKIQQGQNLENAESDNYSGLLPSRNEVSEKRLYLGTRTQNGVNYNSKTENVESSNTFGIGIQKMQPGQNLEKAESDNCSDLIPLEDEVSEKKLNLGTRTRTQNGVNNYNSEAEHVESSDVYGTGIRKMQPGQNLENVDTCSNSIPLRKVVVSEKRSNLGKRTQTGVNYNSKAENVEPSDVFGNEISDLEDEGVYEKEEFIDMPCSSSENVNGYFEDVTCKNKKDAEGIAIQALAKRACTALELRKKLQAKRVPSNVIDEVLTDFQNRGLINDYLYAEAYSRSKWSSSAWGPGRIKQALLQKGVSAANTEKAKKVVFEDDDSSGEKDASLGISKISLDQLFVQASKQWLRSQDVPLDKRKSRMTMWLQYRGFNWRVTSTILKKLESQYPPRVIR